MAENNSKIENYPNSSPAAAMMWSRSSTWQPRHRMRHSWTLVALMLVLLTTEPSWFPGSSLVVRAD